MTKLQIVPFGYHSETGSYGFKHTTLSKSALTVLWIHFLRFFWRQKYQREKIQLFCFYIKMEKRLKTSPRISFLIENQKFHYRCSLNWLSRTCGSTFLRFFWGKKYQRRKIHLFGKIIKMKKPVITLRKIDFSKKNFFHFSQIENRVVNP